MSDTIFANLPSFDGLAEGQPSGRLLTRNAREAETLAQELQAKEASFERQVTAVEATLNSLADKITAVEAEARRQTNETIVAMASRLFPELSKRFLADEIALHLEKFIPPSAVEVVITAEPDLAERLQAVVKKSERLASVCSLKSEPSPKGDRVDVSWKSGGLSFDFDSLLESCLEHIDTTHAAMGATS
ncbi:hypothetical protein WNY37_18040 [Henriciella sp. AS95]|uniref:hypothetical protein n=1 Tax=Henriciella sp. AS95 TaxID=3135782 RepID=UPI0031821621